MRPMADPPAALARPGCCAFRLVCLALALACAARCRPAIPPPALSPPSAAAAPPAQHGTNQDGYLDAQELERCPALKSALKQLDKNNDGRIDASEIEARLASFQQSGTNVMGMSVQVLLGDQPLTGATVRLIPEKFLGDGIKP